MYLVVLGLVLLLMKYFEYGPVALWAWWLVLAPFGAAILWWIWADASGWTKRREMDKMELRKKLRREQNLAALGMDEKGRRSSKKR